LGKFIDLTGQKFNKLLVIEKIGKSRHGDTLWSCKCDCGNEKVITSQNLRSGNSGSCGCDHKKQLSERCKKYNQYDLLGEYGIGHTGKGEEFYFDLDDYELIKDYCWHINDSGYVMTTIPSTRKRVRFHRLVLEVYGEDEVDHINHVRHDNRKNNIRKCTTSENNHNQSITKRNKSGVIGVSWSKKENKWVSQICVSGKHMRIGSYKEFYDAVVARLKAEQYYFGEFAPQKHLFEQYEII
jgi:hypothetical protein